MIEKEMSNIKCVKWEKSHLVRGNFLLISNMLWRKKRTLRKGRMLSMSNRMISMLLKRTSSYLRPKSNKGRIIMDLEFRTLTLLYKWNLEVCRIWRILRCAKLTYSMRRKLGSRKLTSTLLPLSRKPIVLKFAVLLPSNEGIWISERIIKKLQNLIIWRKPWKIIIWVCRTQRMELVLVRWTVLEVASAKRSPLCSTCLKLMIVSQMRT